MIKYRSISPLKLLHTSLLASFILFALLYLFICFVVFKQAGLLILSRLEVFDAYDAADFGVLSLELALG